MLEVRQLDVTYGEVPALQGVAVRVAEGESVAVLGANGAGKSTLLRAISGLLRPRGGQILLDDMRLDQLPAYEIASLGIAHVPEGRRVLPDMTVEENLELGAYLPKPKARRKETLTRIYEIFPRLAERRRQRAGLRRSRRWALDRRARPSRAAEAPRLLGSAAVILLIL